MLQRISIKDFVLIDCCEVVFQSGLNVITGETGAGKSVIISALSFLLGEKHDAASIRYGAVSATVEACFELNRDSPVFSILEQAGIDYQDGEELIIKRELKSSNKTRTLINNQSASATLIKQLAAHLMEFSSQHAHLKLLEEEAALHFLDLFAHIEK